MDDKQRQHIAMTARMEGDATIARNIGRKVKISEMELLTLCNFAEIGIMHVFSLIGGETGEDAQRTLDGTIATIQAKVETSPGKNNGLTSLTGCCAALLRQPRFHRYIFRPEGEAE